MLDHRDDHSRSPWGALLFFTALASSLAGNPVAAQWNEPERVTFNTIEDRTGSGSLVQVCLHESSAIWMEEQTLEGWRLMWATRDFDGWSTPEPVDPGHHADFEPRIVSDDSWNLHAVWQRGTGDAAEIMYGTRPYGGTWIVEPITANSTADLAPDIANIEAAGDLKPHVAWIGFDPQSGAGKVFHAARGIAGWETEVLADSELGPFWTGAEPRIDVDYAATVHIVYRGGDYGDYHAHYARKDAQGWTIQILYSGNINDFSVDVSSQNRPRLMVAMAGNDGWGFPYRIYVRESLDGGSSFGPPVLVSHPYSATLANLTDGYSYDAQVVGEEISGNILTGDLIYSNEEDGWAAEKLPPVNQASASPSTGQSRCIEAVAVSGVVSVLYTNTGGHGTDSTEVYYLDTWRWAGVESPSNAAPAGLRIDAAPNPFAASTWITIDMRLEASPVSMSIYDLAGRLVRRLATDEATSSNGRTTLLWDGRAAGGQRVAPGTYIARLDAGTGTATARLVLVR